MSYIYPDLARRAASALNLHSVPRRGLADRPAEARPIAAAILALRAEIAELEADWAAESERAAARSLGGVARLGERATWDRATWTRYLSASAECQHRYQPRLRRLYADLARLEEQPLPNAIRPRRAA